MSTALRAHNLAVVKPLLAECPVRLIEMEANDGMAAVDVVLATAAGPLRARIENNVDGAPAFARSKSFAVSHLGQSGAQMAAASVTALRAFVHHLSKRDPGGIVLTSPRSAGVGTADARKLTVLREQAGDTSWSRALFDRNIARLTRSDGPFVSAILVVVQPCEMSCRFCPSGDIERATPEGLDDDKQYSDLLHQIAAARGLGVDTLEIGGNDVLLYTHAIKLFRAAGTMGFTTISAQSPGQRLADEEFARALSESPLEQVDLPIYGATAEIHESVTRAKGSFDGLCRAVDIAQKLGRPKIRLHTIALESTLHKLNELIEFGRRRFGLEVHVELLRPNRLGEREHLSDAASLSDIRRSAERHPSSFGGDIPLCALPRQRAIELYEERAPVGVFHRRLHLWDLGLRDESADFLAMQDRSSVPLKACETCSVRGGCPGVLRVYADRFGTEIAPIEMA